MTSFTNAALSTTTVAQTDVDAIFAAHGLAGASTALVTSVCLTCQSITESPDLLTKKVAQTEFDLTCCSPEATIHIP